MTNTIFLFVEDLSFEDYLSKIQDKEIAERTIVFAEKQQAIYKGGQKYGSAGNNGIDGTDGKGIEFIYTRTNGQAPLDNPNSGYGSSNFQMPGFVPTGWTANPMGVDETHRCEWISVRTSDPAGVWSRFSDPARWSNWSKDGKDGEDGEDGKDGNSVEYIYYVGDQVPSTFSNDPTQWYSNSSTKNDFQKDGYKGPSGSEWRIEPIDISTYIQGTKEWISSRKKIDGEWQSFSEPALWAYYGKDGENGVVDGYIINPTNTNMFVNTDSAGTVSNFTDQCAVEVFHNGVKEQNFTLQVANIVRSDGKAVSTIRPSIVRDVVTITGTNIEEFAGVTATITIAVMLPNSSTQHFVIRLTGFAAGIGESGSSINLWTSADTIRTDYYRQTVSPERLEVGLKITKGSEPQSIQKVTETAGYSFKYYYNEEINSVYSLVTDYIALPKDKDSITIQMFYDGMLIDSKRIWYISEGKPGIGIDAVNYSINVLSSTLKYTEGEERFKGSISFSVYKTQGDTRTHMTDLTWTDSDNEKLEVQIGGLDFAGTGSNGTITKPSGFVDSFTFTLPINGWTYQNVNFAVIKLLSAANSVLASVVVPFVVQGKAGSNNDSVQALSGVVMRFIDSSTISNWEDHYFYAGDEPENGIYYMDVVLFEGGYYRVKKSGKGHTNPIDNFGEESNKEWLVFSPTSDAAFEALIAKSAYIENLTAKEIVITDNNVPVAGMTRGTAVGADSVNATRGNVRIWAGNYTDNLTDCPFYVTSAGELHATNAYLKGNINATSGTIAGFDFDYRGLEKTYNKKTTTIDTEKIKFYDSTDEGANTSVGINGPNLALLGYLSPYDNTMTIPSTTGYGYLIIKDKIGTSHGGYVSGGMKTGIYIQMSGSAKDHAILTNGSIYSSGWILSGSFKEVYLSSSDDIPMINNLENYNPFNILVSVVTSISVTPILRLPTYEEIMNVLNQWHSNLDYMLEFNIISAFDNQSSFYIKGNHGGNEDRPTIYNSNGQVVDSIEMKKGNCIKIMLVGKHSKNTAYIMSKNN